MKVSISKFATAAFAAASVLAASSAYAGLTISDQRAWPKEVRAESAQASGSALDAQASADYSVQTRATNTVMYSGGPKTGTR
jgi:hypothetical protein